MGEMGRAFDGGYAEYALVPEHQLIALDTTLPWDVLGALPETFMTAAGSLEHLDLEEGETLLLRGATSSVGLACLELARAAGVRVIATTRSEAKGRRLTELGAAGIVLEGDGFAERARGALPEGGADGAVDLIGGPAVLETLRLLRPGATACNSGSLSDTWVIPDFEPIAMIPSGRKLTVFHSNDVHDARVGGPLLRAVVEQVERGEVAPNIDAVYRSSRRSTRTAGWRRAKRPASSSCCRAPRPPERRNSAPVRWNGYATAPSIQLRCEKVGRCSTSAGDHSLAHAARPPIVTGDCSEVALAGCRCVARAGERGEDRDAGEDRADAGGGPRGRSRHVRFRGEQHQRAGRDAGRHDGEDPEEAGRGGPGLDPSRQRAHPATSRRARR